MDNYCSKCGSRLPDNVKYCPNCGAPVSASGVPSGKDKVTAGLLAIFLGYLGIQYFYLGKTSAGLISILLSLCTCGVWSVVTFIQGIVMLTMTDEVFDAKYVSNDVTFPVF